MAGLGVMLVGEGAADDEVGGGGAPGSEYLLDHSSAEVY